MTDRRFATNRLKTLPFQRLFWVLSLAMFSASCSFVDGQIDLAYRVEAERRSPLSAIKPLTLRVEVVDQRDVPDPLLIGYKKSGFGNVVASIKAKQELPSVLRQALESELRHNGHAIALDNEARCDATLVVRLKKFWTEPIVKIVDVQVLGSVNADVEVSAWQSQRIATRIIIGSRIESWPLSINDGYDRVLNGALREFVRNFARDATIQNALREILSH